MAPTCFGLRPSLGSLQFSLAKIYIVQSTAQNTHAILGHAATPPHNKLRRNLTECFNININFSQAQLQAP